LLTSSTEINPPLKSSFNQFKKIHNQNTYRDQLAVVCNILLPQQDGSNRDYAKALMKFETGCGCTKCLPTNQEYSDFFHNFQDYHEGDLGKVTFCLKSHLGNSDRSKLLFSLAEEQPNNPVSKN